MNVCWRVLFERVHPFWRHVLVLLPCAVLPSLALGLLAHSFALALDVGRTSLPGASSAPLVSAFLSIAFAPLVETVFLASFIETGRSLKQSNIRIAIAAGVMAGILHGIASPIWFFQSAWGFFVYACAYLAWRPASLPRAFSIAAVTHALNNAIAAAALQAYVVFA